MNTGAPWPDLSEAERRVRVMQTKLHQQWNEHMESRMQWKLHVRSDPYTEHPTREGKVYCAVVLDVFSRRVVGWSIDNSATSGLVTSALGMAIGNRLPDPGTVIHSDQGTQFTSWAFTQRAHESGLVPSMGTVGDCFDNAIMESFWARMQVEPLDRQRWRTRIELANAKRGRHYRTPLPYAV